MDFYKINTWLKCADIQFFFESGSRTGYRSLKYLSIDPRAVNCEDFNGTQLLFCINA